MDATDKLEEIKKHADQLFDENQFQEAVNLLKTYPVSSYHTTQYHTISKSICFHLQYLIAGPREKL